MSDLTIQEIDAYYGKSHVLHDVSLSVEQGDTTLLLGRNGAGKSTLIKSIMGLVTVDGGSIRHRETDITGWKTEDIADRGIAYIPERRRIFPNLSVEENLRLAKLGRDSDRTIESVIERFPNLQKMLDQPGRSLSGGEQQMLTIARALIQDPSILLIDEPSEGLMPKLVKQVFELIGDLNDQELTILLSEQHAQEALDVADYGYIVQQGEIVADGSSEELQNQPELLDQYIGMNV